MGPHGKRQLSNKKKSTKSIHPDKSYQVTNKKHREYLCLCNVTIITNVIVNHAKMDHIFYIIMHIDLLQRDTGKFHHGYIIFPILCESICLYSTQEGVTKYSLTHTQLIRIQSERYLLSPFPLHLSKYLTPNSNAYLLDTIYILFCLKKAFYSINCDSTGIHIFLLSSRLS